MSPHSDLPWWWYEGFSWWGPWHYLNLTEVFLQVGRPPTWDWSE